MAFLTDRKRATGLGSAHSGVHHAWEMKISSVALLVLIPFFVFLVGPVIGAEHDAVIAHFARPFVAIVTGLTLVVGMMHFKSGIQVAIEDYAKGTLRRLLIIASICLSWGIAATGLFALARIAL